jgi:hypothetical protein
MSLRNQLTTAIENLVIFGARNHLPEAPLPYARAYNVESLYYVMKFPVLSQTH